MSAKRERSINFSREEVELLTSLVAQNKNVLENKKSDAVTWQQKEKCWKSLETVFNSTSGVSFRSVKTLKAKYEGIKRATRKKSAVIRAETYRTGGGPSDAPPLTPIENKIKEMILLSVEGLESQYDCDHLDSTEPIDLNTIELKSIEDSEIIIENNNTIVTEPTATEREDSDDEQAQKRKINECTSAKVTNDWANWKPKSLRSKKHPALSAPKTKRPYERVADAKLEVVDLQKRILEEELLNKRKQWEFEEEERDHKRELWALEKKNLSKVP